MCTLAVKPKGVATPKTEYLINMFKNNPNGAGVAWACGGKISVIKGLMTEADFLKACEKIPVDAVALIHCRITTSGGTCKELTHPFRLCADIKEMRKTKAIYESGCVVGHNGIFSEFKTKDLNNDTTQFIITYLNNLQSVAERGGVSILCEEYKPIINQLVNGSRLAILNTEGGCCIYGSGWQTCEGVYYSNGNFKPYEPIYYNGYGSYNNYSKYNSFYKEYYKTIHNEDLKEYAKEASLKKEILKLKAEGYSEWQILNYIESGYLDY